MSDRPIITLGAWYRFDPTLFNNLAVPSGASKDTLIDTIIDMSSEFGTLYHDPTAIKAQIGLLSDRFSWGMARDWRVLHEEYNPLYNFDRHEDYTDTETGSSSQTGTSTASGETKNGGTVSNVSSTTNGGTVSDSGNATASVMAFDSTTFKDRDKTTQSNTQTINTTVGVNDTQTIDTDVTATGSTSSTTNGTNERELVHTAHLYGNIGTTRSQEMVTDEHNLALTMEFYSTWATMFINALCVCIY